MLNVRVDGVWLRSIGAYGELTYSHTWPHGSEQATWVMASGVEHKALRGGVLVEIFAGGIRIWRGILNEPGLSGEFAARGIWAEAENVYALTGAGAASNTVDIAVDAAIARGAVSWTRPATLVGVAWGTPSEPLALGQLLDDVAASQTKRAYVDADGAVRFAADPTTPKWVVPQAVAGHGLTLAEDAYYSHLVGTYISAGPVFATATVGSTAASSRWGYKEAPVDLTPMGVITAVDAAAQLNGRLLLTGARMGFAESLNLAYGQITTLGGVPIALTMPRAGDMIRLMGVVDETKPVSTLGFTDIVLGRSSYAEGAHTVQLDPVGKAARNLSEALKVAVA